MSNLVKLPDQKVKIHESNDKTVPAFVSGLYLGYGKTASGKTLSTVALQKWLTECGVTTGYFNVNEPRGEWTTSIDKLAEADSKQIVANFIDYVNKRFIENPNMGVCVIDSAVVAMFMAVSMFENLPTFSGGYSPAHALFLGMLSDAYRTQSKAVIFMINSELFPVRSLEGSVEGLLEIQSPGVFRMRDRVNRSFKEYTIPEKMVEEAANALGYAKTASVKNILVTGVTLGG